MCSYMEHQEELYIEQHLCMQEMVMQISCNQFAISIGIEYVRHAICVLIL